MLLPPGACLWGVHRAPGVSGSRHDLAWPVSSESPTGRCCGPTQAGSIPASTEGPGELWRGASGVHSSVLGRALPGPSHSCCVVHLSLQRVLPSASSDPGRRAAPLRATVKTPAVGGVHCPPRAGLTGAPSRPPPARGPPASASQSHLHGLRHCPTCPPLPPSFPHGWLLLALLSAPAFGPAPLFSFLNLGLRKGSSSLSGSFILLPPPAWLALRLSLTSPGFPAFPWLLPLFRSSGWALAGAPKTPWASAPTPVPTLVPWPLRVPTMIQTSQALTPGDPRPAGSGLHQGCASGE